MCILITTLLSACGESKTDTNTTGTTVNTTESMGETTTEGTAESTTTTTENTTVSPTESTTESTTETTTETTTSTPETTTEKEDEPTTRPTVVPPTVDPGSQDAVDAYFNDAVFIGDSIGVGLKNRAIKTNKLTGATFLVKGSYGSGNAVNKIMLLNYQGKQMEPQDAVAACGAKKVFIMLGMNDLNVYGLQGSVDNMAILINRILAKSPDVKIIIQSMTPIVIGSESGKLNNKSIDEYNDLLKTFANNNGYTYLDVTSYLKDSSNGLKKSYSGDNYVHLSNSGNDVYISVLESYAQSQLPPVESEPIGEDEPTTVNETTTYNSTQQMENSKRRNIVMSKKITAASLVLAIIFCFCSCASVNEDSDKNGNKDNANVNIDLRTLYEECVEKMPPMLLLDGEMMLDYCGINPEDCEEYYVSICEDSLRADEIWLIKVADVSKTQAIVDLANARIQAKAEESKTYSPEQYAIVQKAQIISQGEYIAVVVSPDVETIFEIITNAF